MGFESKGLDILKTWVLRKLGGHDTKSNIWLTKKEGMNRET